VDINQLVHLVFEDDENLAIHHPLSFLARLLDQRRTHMQVIKRSGEIVEFDPDKIYQAIIKAAQTVYVIDDTWRQNLAQVTKKVVLDLEDAHTERPTISMVQSQVEHRLLDAGYITIAEHYISYRLQRDLERNGYGDKIIVHLHFEQVR
jgi:ribonucleoside-triphosphate reductase